MNRVLEIDPWKIVERGFDPWDTMASESIFSIGNGLMGGRANFEETYTGRTLQGNYIGGVYYPDRTRVGWWKNGYPEYFAKVINSAFWPGVNVTVNGQPLDLARLFIDNKETISDFYRELDMYTGILTRRFTVTLRERVTLAIEARRFVSMELPETAALSYSVRVVHADTPVNVELDAYIEGNVRNEDANYDEKFWELITLSSDVLTMRTRKTGYTVSWAQNVALETTARSDRRIASTEERISEHVTLTLNQGDKATLYKYVGIVSSLNHPVESLPGIAAQVANKAAGIGFENLLLGHAGAWKERWDGCDIRIDGDDKAQQGIRFCIFQLLQTYTGLDSRLNIGPKGFTGEKYGGSTYWDTEAYCLPFYLATSGEAVARQLLQYRHDQLGKAIENAGKLGFHSGAALYPMVTMTGEECHNEWEITFEEIHRNGAIAYAIYNYCRYTGTKDYLAKGGLEVLIGIARFWAQRATFSNSKQQYVILGVTGPNEYENNVNNNWYTNYLAQWCLRYAVEAAGYVEGNDPDDYRLITSKTGLNKEYNEFDRWKTIAEGLYFPRGEGAQEGIFLQQEGYMDKEQIMAADLPADQRPINQHWSWDRILRSCFIKQADVLQGMYFFRDRFSEDEIRRNFLFYEPRTVHESSLSPCVHSILASALGLKEKAYEMYLRASRLDLDDYNKEVHEGLHITSMAGSWLSVVEGFGGVRVADDGLLTIDPHLPDSWQSIAFRIHYRGTVLAIALTREKITLRAENGHPATVRYRDREHPVTDQETTITIE